MTGDIDIPHGERHDQRHHSGTAMVRVLGPIEVHTSDGSTIAFPTQKREIIAAIAASGEVPLDRDVLCHALWGDNSSVHRHRLVSQVTQIRSMLPEGIDIAFVNGGYRFTGSPTAVDVIQFERLLTTPSDDQDVRLRALVAALALWRGPYPFAGASNPMVDDAVHHLTRLRESTLLELCDLEHQLRRPATELDQLRILFDDDPTRGDVAARLARALDDEARDLEALRVIGEHRAALGIHGTVANRAIDELESEILQHDGPSASSSSADGASKRATLPRPAVVLEMQQRLASRSLVMVGEPGSGKSVLVREWAAQTSPLPIVVHVPPSPNRPMEALHSLITALQNAEPEAFAAMIEHPDHRAAWQCLAADRGHRTPLLSRDEVVAGLVGLLAGLLHRHEGVVTVEDVHHLDAVSVTVLSEAMAATRAGAVLLTSRTVIPQLSSGIEVLHIPAFTSEEVAALAGDALLRRGAQLAADIHRRSGGNPLFVSLLLELLAAAHLDVALPRTLDFAIQARLMRFSARTIEALRICALLGSRFDSKAVEAVVPRASEAIAEAAAEGLIAAVGDRWQFSHELIAEHLAESTAPGMRTALHDQLCDALIANGASALEIAHHAVVSVSIDPVRAARWTLVAARQHSVVADWTQVIKTVSAGLDGLDPEHDDVLLIDLLTLRGAARRRDGISGSDDDLLAAAQSAVRLNDDTRLALATTELCLHGPTSISGDVDQRVAPVLEAALVALADPAAAVGLRAAAATLYTMSSKWDEGRILFHDAIRRSAELGDSDARRGVLLNAHVGLGHPDDRALRRSVADELLALGDSEASWEAGFLRFGLALIEADRHDLTMAAATMEAEFPHVTQRRRTSGMAMVRSVMALLAGNLETAEEQAVEAYQASLVAQTPSWALGTLAGLMYPIREAQGRLGELREAASRLRAEHPGFPLWITVDSAIAARQGDVDGARTGVTELASLGFRFERDLTWTAAVSLAMRAVWAVGDRAAADELASQLLPYAGSMSWNGVSTNGPIDAALALGAALAGRRTDATHHLRVADSLLARLGAPQLRWAELDQLR